MQSETLRTLELAAIQSQVNTSPRVVAGKELTVWTKPEVDLLLASARESKRATSDGINWSELKKQAPSVWQTLTRDGRRNARSVMQKYSQLKLEAKEPGHNKRTRAKNKAKPARGVTNRVTSVTNLVHGSEHPAVKPMKLPGYCPHCGGPLAPVIAAFNVL